MLSVFFVQSSWEGKIRRDVSTVLVSTFLLKQQQQQNFIFWNDFRCMQKLGRWYRAFTYAPHLESSIASILWPWHIPQNKETDIGSWPWTKFQTRFQPIFSEGPSGTESASVREEPFPSWTLCPFPKLVTYSDAARELVEQRPGSPDGFRPRSQEGTMFQKMEGILIYSGCCADE